jgi:hypothetical protein
METLVTFVLVTAFATAIYGVSRMTLGGTVRLRAHRRAAGARLFPAAMTQEAHWSRVTSVVERSLGRANAMASHHAAASRQLEAADYALHCLLSELGQVMKTTVTSPLAVRSRPVPVVVAMPSAALAA